LPRRKAKDQKQARALQRQLIRDLELGRDSQAENPTVAVWVEQWIASKRNLKPSTERRYQISLEHQIKPHKIGRLRLSQVTYRHVEEWIDALIVQPRRDDLRGWTSKPDESPPKLDAYSIRNAFALLRAALNTAVQRDVIAKNPFYERNPADR
jgi:hypothetical protein